ncbi:MAG: hypothetical protein FWF75_07815, partial [Propionibacteriaceae bacterium]|nr:hypothetical protein [Propionibacteriaceae bacterium]
MSAQWPAGGRGRHPVAPLRTQPAQVYTPPTQPPVFDPALTVSATVLMVAGGIVGFIGVCSRYYQISIPDGRGPMTDNLGLAMSGPGWAVPYAGPAAVILLCAAGLALFDMRWVPRPRGAQPSPWPKYVLMAGVGG